MGTLLVGAVVVVCIALAVRSVLKTRKSGGCGCGCENCHGACYTQPRNH